MDGFELRTEKKKEQIINTSITLFQSISPKKVSIRDLAKEANVSVATLYNYFGSKEGLIQEVVRAVLSEQLKVAEEIAYSEESFEEKIAKIIFSKNTMIQHFHPEFINLILKDRNMVQMINNEFLNRTYELITKFINDAKEEGKITKDLSNELILKIIELYRKDLSSEQSVLSSNEHSLDPSTLINVLLYGIAGKQST